MIISGKNSGKGEMEKTEGRGSDESVYLQKYIGKQFKNEKKKKD